eukprot:6464300-Amphidinium_carterae.1
MRFECCSGLSGINNERRGGRCAVTWIRGPLVGHWPRSLFSVRTIRQLHKEADRALVFFPVCIRMEPQLEAVPELALDDAIPSEFRRLDALKRAIAANLLDLRA